MKIKRKSFLIALAFLVVLVVVIVLVTKNTGCGEKTFSGKIKNTEISFNYPTCVFSYESDENEPIPGLPKPYYIENNKVFDNTGAVARVVIEPFDLLPQEEPVAALKRLFFSNLSPYQKTHCVPGEISIASYSPNPVTESQGGKTYWDIFPDNEYNKKIKDEAGTDIPASGCGEYGYQPDTLSYFEFHKGSSIFLRVSPGQEWFFDLHSVKF